MICLNSTDDKLRDFSNEHMDIEKVQSLLDNVQMNRVSAIVFNWNETWHQPDHKMEKIKTK